MKLKNLKQFSTLSRNELQNVLGGKMALETEYNCYCNGVPTGTAKTPDGCAAKCQ